MFCKNCGMPVDAQKDICPNCGVRLRETRPNGDASSTGFAVLGFFFPLIGLILYLVWKSDYPLKAKSCGKGALISVIVSAALVVLYIIIFVILFASVAAAGALPAPT